MNAIQYLDMLIGHMFDTFEVQGYHAFMHDGEAAHKSKTVQKWLSDSNISVLDWPGNSPDLKVLLKVYGNQ